MGTVYETGRRLLAADPNRWQLSALKALFADVALLEYDAS